MKKLLGFSLILVVVIAAGLYITVQYFLGSIVKSGVNKYGPAITQTEVELQSAKLSAFSGEGTLEGLVVGNPQGWSQADAFRLGKVHLNMEPASVFKDHIIVNELVIEQPEFLYETRLVSSNIQDLLENIEESIGTNRAEVKTEEGEPVKMVVKKLVLKEGKVTVGLGTAAVTVPLPVIDMADIGTAEGGITPAQVAFAVMREVTANIATAAAGAIAQGGIGGAGETAKQVGAIIQGILGARKSPNAEPAPEPKSKK